MARNLKIVGALGLTLLAAPQVHAASADVDAQTLSLFKQEPRDGKTYPTYPTWARLNFALRSLNLPKKATAGMVVSTWARFDGAQPRDGRALTGDIGLAYMDAALEGDRVNLRAGRQMVFEGGTRGVHMDGVFVRGTLWHGLGASAWAGLPVRPMLDDHQGSGLAGARVFWRHSTHAELGASFVHVMELGDVTHQDFSLDGRYRLFSQVVLTSFARWSALESTRPGLDLIPPRPLDPHTSWTPGKTAVWGRDAAPSASDAWGRATLPLQEAELAAAWQPTNTTQLMLDYRRTSPGLFLSRTSIFSVFSDERRDHLGASAWSRPLRWLEVQGDAHGLHTSAGWGLTGGTRGILRLPVAPDPLLLGAEGRVLRLWNNGYWQARLFGSHRVLGFWHVSGDADLHVLHQPVNGQWFETSVSATSFVNLPGGFNLGGAVLAGKSPLVSYRMEALLRLSWGASLPLSGRLW